MKVNGRGDLWLWIFRAASLASALPGLSILIIGFQPCAHVWPGPAIIALPYMYMFSLSLWPKTGWHVTALAIPAGGGGGALGLWFYQDSIERSSPIFPYSEAASYAWMAFVATQVLLIAAGIAAWVSRRKVPAQPTGGLVLLSVYGVGSALLAVCAFLAIMVPYDVYRTSAIRPYGMISILNQAQLRYAQARGSFSTELSALDIFTVREEDLRSPTSFEFTGYRYVYTPGAPDAAGRIRTYSIVAHPISPWARPCTLRFFSDQTGVVRITSEGRLANAGDPPLVLDTRGAGQITFGVEPARPAVVPQQR